MPSVPPETTGVPGPAATRDRLVVAAGIVAAIAVVVVHWSTPLLALGLAAVVAVSTRLAVIDFQEHRLPNRIVGPLAVAVTIGLIVAGIGFDDPGRAGRAAALGLATAAVLLVVNLVGGLGMGDVKYGYPAAATVGWFGWDALATAALATTVSGAVVAAWLLVAGRGRGHQFSYGPYMVVGVVAGLLSAGGP